MPTLKVYALLLTLAALYLGASVPPIPAGFRPFAGLLAASFVATAVGLWIRWRWSGILYLAIFSVITAWAALQVVKFGAGTEQLLYLFAAIVALSGFGVIQKELRK